MPKSPSCLVKMKYYIRATFACLVFPLAVFGSDTNSNDKSGYSLFNPVPKNELRPLTSVVYDNVTDARTLDVGHFQVEGQFIDYYHVTAHVQRPELSYRYTGHEYLWEPRITVGLLNNVDVYIRPSYGITASEERGTYFLSPFTSSASTSRFGRITTGAEINLWGNDGGTTALAVKPFLSIPTHGGDVLGGSDLALLVRLPRDFYLKFDTEFFATEDNSNAVHAGFYNAMSINKTLCSKAEAYWHLDSTVTTVRNQQWYGYTGFGMKYNVTSDLQLFAGMGFGLTSTSFDYNPRFGFVWRL
jgi:hypothetical protein